jgi:hypothetical protein
MIYQNTKIVLIKNIQKMAKISRNGLKMGKKSPKISKKTKA